MVYGNGSYASISFDDLQLYRTFVEHIVLRTTMVQRPSVKTVPADSPIETILEILHEDGVLVLSDFVSPPSTPYPSHQSLLSGKKVADMFIGYGRRGRCVECESYSAVWEARRRRVG